MNGKIFIARRDIVSKVKIMKKLLIITFIAILFAGIAIMVPCFAEGEDDTFVSPLDRPGDYKPDVAQNKSGITLSMVAIIIKWLRNVGLIVSILAVTIIGFNYMLAGATEEKAKYKETLVPIVIGVVMLLGALTIIDIILNIFV